MVYRLHWLRIGNRSPSRGPCAGLNGSKTTAMSAIALTKTIMSAITHTTLDSERLGQYSVRNNRHYHAY